MYRVTELRVVWMALLCVAMSCGALTARAFTAADADTMFNAYAKAFYREESGRAWFAESTEGGKASYWMRAEQMEMCKDGYLPPAGEKGDGGGFNGIGARWIARFMKDSGEQATFEPWLQKNAEAARKARRPSA